jgi:hypothetical protein
MTTPLTILRRAALTGAALAALGTTSASAFTLNDPALAVPADKIEHVVREITIHSIQPTHIRTELFLASDRAHWISRDATTNRVVGETTFAKGQDGLTTPPWQSVAQEANNWRHVFDEGKTRQVGETTVDGRRALILESVRGKWVTDEDDQITTMVVDAETFTPYDITTKIAKIDFSQDIAIRSLETLPRTAQNERLLDPLSATASKAGAKAIKKAPKKAKKHAKRARR